MGAREAQLKESEKSLSLHFFQHSPLGVLHFDEQGQITDCNSKLLDILGVERSNLLGYRMLDRSADRDVAQAVKDALEKRHRLLRRHVSTAPKPLRERR